MKPFQPRCPCAQIERKWPATKDYFSFSEEAIAFLACPRAGGARCEVACRSEGRPRFANFPVIPAPGVGQFDRRIDCLNLRSIFGADALNTQDVDPLHGRLPEPLTWNKRIIVHRRQICEFSPYHHPVPSCSSQVSQACRPASTAGRLMGGVSVRSPPCKFSRRSALRVRFETHADRARRRTRSMTEA